MPRSSADGQKRRLILAKLLEDHENVSTSELASQLDVSEMTVRRDLKQLQKEGIALPCYGGAMVARRITFEFDFEEHRRSHLVEKQRIGKAAVEEIEPGQTIFLDTGTTTLELARVLANLSMELTVVTASLVIASELWARGNTRLQLLGGQVRGGNPDLAGPLTELMLEKITADVAFLGSDGVSASRGSFAGDLETARIAERMVACADRAVVVCDSSKLGRNGPVRYAVLSDIDLLITDKKVNRNVARQLTSRGLKIKKV
ncbi:DeoR/GlpR family DNA-binding transcription regulator [Adhaeretor mobilis]|uniref:Glycerol-3-phosphate regulon repressor n=1 Tax=Adhaeretor mobilis TaxID=1930276 RepID=A0A517MTU7_9BACT|nr:DeoR/GlpR family DNA-binding transcription regulator [Adhaeretor mobilis]QDS98207.1 Glycerol-3-phosphate regulon repressor [Adhaeretor mobilis]